MRFRRSCRVTVLGILSLTLIGIAAGQTKSSPPSDFLQLLHTMAPGPADDCGDPGSVDADVLGSQHEAFQRATEIVVDALNSSEPGKGSAKDKASSALKELER